MKPFVINRYGRIVFPESFFPELDFSVFDTLDQFAAVIKRDFEEKAPSETDIVARVEAFLWLHRDHHVTPFGTLDDPKTPQGFQCYACGETLTLTAIFDRLH